ncbi:hypothetical protein NHG68_12525 [Enterobacter sp. Z1]|uniref:hypothetical protein n=1 Tax=Enterobacter sp. Z1 TaxID=2561927 RepID=UPI0011DF8F57|nr:hypothetical protein [Enterobacter sp. Z1]TYD08303.1 hypothetical protein E4M14_003795 [Enterobacter sp. Z1]USX29943.1 hypothetical protein NHG68_12525 [Enterobacter sp. Z1]
MQEYKHIKELLADARFDSYDLHSGQLIDQYIFVVQDAGDEFLQWDLTLRNGQAVHFRELKNTLMQPKVLASCKNFILGSLPKAYSQ